MEFTPEITAMKEAVRSENKTLISNDGAAAAAAATITNSEHKSRADKQHIGNTHILIELRFIRRSIIISKQKTMSVQSC